MTDGLHKDPQQNAIDGKYMTTIKVGPRGQIVIPKEARDLFNIASGDILLLRADVEGGIAIQPYYMVKDVFDDIFSQNNPQAD